jgi:hypothetical protein
MADTTRARHESFPEVRTCGLVGGDFSSYWVYVAGPLMGALLGSGAAQGDLFTEVRHPDKA